MAEKGIFSGKEILKEVVLDVLTFLGLLKLTEKGERQLNPEVGEKIFKRIEPHIFGLGPQDEAIFATAMSKLPDRPEKVRLSRWIDTLSKYDRRKLGITIAVLPDENDRISVLKMLSELADGTEMTLVAKACRLISGAGEVGPLGQGVQEAVEGIKKIYKDSLLSALLPVIEEFWPWLTASTPEELVVFPKTAKLVEKLRKHTEEKKSRLNWFARLHK